MNYRFLDKLLGTIKKNKNLSPKISYTAKLYKSGIKFCKKKFHEEVLELLNSFGQRKKNSIHEAADVIYHYLVLLERRNIEFKDVLKELKNRNKISGIKEKLNRKNVRSK